MNRKRPRQQAQQIVPQKAQQQQQQQDQQQQSNKRPGPPVDVDLWLDITSMTHVFRFCLQCYLFGGGSTCKLWRQAHEALHGLR